MGGGIDAGVMVAYTARAQRGLPVYSSILHADEAGLARRNVRHNAVALGADFALFLVGLAFASQSTILPAFAAHLGAPNVVIGAIPAVMTLGWFLPSLFAAGHTESLARKLPFVMRFTLWERVPFLALALIAFFVATPAPAVALAALLLLLLLVTGTGGVLMPAWMDIVGRAIPTTLRGRFFGVANVLGSAGGLVGSLGTAYLLARVPAPASYGVCFLCAAFCMGLSYVALALVREPAAAATGPRQPMSAHLARPWIAGARPQPELVPRRARLRLDRHHCRGVLHGLCPAGLGRRPPGGWPCSPACSSRARSRATSSSASLPTGRGIDWCRRGHSSGSRERPGAGRA